MIDQELLVAEASSLPDESKPSPEAFEYGRWLFAQSCDFVNGSTKLDTIPPAELPEIGFAGRSNVGKSSLVNALTGRKTLARASHTPGRTQQINFFILGRRCMLADLPGYGYAEAPKHEIQRWTRLVNDYLRGRPTLRRVCLLVDSRHGLKPNDLPVMKLLDEAAVSYQVVLTKIDKLRESERKRVENEVASALVKQRASHPYLHMVSSFEGEGIPELRAALAALAPSPSLN